MVKQIFRATVLRHPPEDIGQSLITWKFPEYVKHDRDKKWYIGAAILIGLALLYAIVTVNFLFAIIVLMFSFIGIFQYFQQPQMLRVTLAEDGVLVGKRFYGFDELEAFWIVYQPPQVKNLYFDFKKEGKRSLTIPLEDVNPLQVRETLEYYLEENLDREVEFFDEILSRTMKLQ